MELITTMKKKKTRLIVRKGNENVVLKVEDIHLFIEITPLLLQLIKKKRNIYAIRIFLPWKRN